MIRYEEDDDPEDDDPEYDSDEYHESGSGSGVSSFNIRRDARVHGLDAYVKRNVKHVLSLAEWAARTTQEFKPVGVMGESIRKQVGDLNFYAPKAKSASWMPKFSTLINYAHSARVTKLTPALKKKLREGGERFYKETGVGTRGEGDCDRCVVCKTKEHNSKWCIDLAGNPEWRSYDAREFLQKPQQWGKLYDQAWKQHSKIFEPDWAPKDDMCMPCEFIGSFAVGETCLKHLVSALAAQNLPFDTIYNAMSELRDIEDKMEEIPEYDELCTVTDERILQWYTQCERIQYSLATDGNTVHKPGLQYCDELWAKIDNAITDSVGTKSMSALYEQCGYWAARNMHRASLMAPGTSEDKDKERRAPERRRTRRDAGHPSDEEDDKSDHPRPRARRRRRVVDESESDHDEGSTVTLAAIASSSNPSQSAKSKAPVAVSPAAPPPSPVRAPVREPRNPLCDLASAASDLRSLVTGPSPEHRLLRGYATTIAELFDLGRIMTEKEMHVEAAVAGRGAIVLQELAIKYQDERQR